jgi:hypothetical protein
MLFLSWFTRRRLGDEACWDFGCPSFHDQNISKRELGRERRGRTGGELASDLQLLRSLLVLEPVRNSELALVSCSMVDLEGGGNSDLSEGAEQ